MIRCAAPSRGSSLYSRDTLISQVSIWAILIIWFVTESHFIITQWCTEAEKEPYFNNLLTFLPHTHPKKRTNIPQIVRKIFSPPIHVFLRLHPDEARLGRLRQLLMAAVASGLVAQASFPREVRGSDHLTWSTYLTYLPDKKTFSTILTRYRTPLPPP